ncbi:hypothetical protein JTE90_018596 [Oedothorax gibbosus]|uniref:Uncharacterized protein n=1 Tax=Oedothorax gibbosus TaxID=931172 RepID=A0AAV6TS88_9ARAC|nr:hypothetical protein JTE90_018596 [Oedothorax gibbosus]
MYRTFCSACYGLNNFYGNCCYSRGFKIATLHLVFGIYLSQLVVVCLQCYIDSTRLPTVKEVVSQEN